MDNKTTNRESIIVILSIFVLLPTIIMAGIFVIVYLTGLNNAGITKQDLCRQLNVSTSEIQSYMIIESSGLQTQMTKNTNDLQQKMDTVMEKIDALKRELEEMKQKE